MNVPYPPVDTDGYRYCALAERKTANKSWTHPISFYRPVAQPAFTIFPILAFSE